MNLLEIILAVISVISFLLAVFSFLRTEIHEINEKAKFNVMRERLNAIYRGLSSLYHSADAMVQIPKARKDVSVDELQDIARLLRSQIYSQAELIKKSRAQMEKWKFGKMIPSERIDEPIQADGKEGYEKQ